MKRLDFNLMEKPSDNGLMPRMMVYLLDRNDEGPRPMVVIFPGGGYGAVCGNWEGERIAMEYAAAGFQTAVVYYGVAPDFCHPVPILNAAKAIRICRENSEEWQVNPEQIAVCGFSAGGHLAAGISTLWNCPEIFSQEDIESRIYRPNASVLCYPVITSGEKAHKPSFVNLTGGKPETDPLWELLSLEKQVDGDTPPTFLWHTFADSTVPLENSLYYASALRENGVPFEMHIYPNGCHGLSLTTKKISRKKSMFERNYNWMNLSIDWLYELFGNFDR